MQRAAAAASSSALRRLVAEAFTRSPTFSRAASFVATTFSRPLAAFDRHRQLTLLYPIYNPCRGYANRRGTVPSDTEDDDDSVDEDEDDDDWNSDEDKEAGGEFSETEEEDDLGKMSEMSD